MRASTHPTLRTALLALCGVSIAVALTSFALAFTVATPSRTLRPVIPSVDSMYTPVYISMVAAGLLILAALVAIVSSLHGNRAVDLAACLGLLASAALALASLALAAAIKTSAETSLESTLKVSLTGYGPGNVSVYQAWDDMQRDLACCGVRTNYAQDNFQTTPWYRQLRAGNPFSVPKIPNSCCGASATSVSQVSDCTTNLPTLPAQNKYMNPVGCFEALRQITDAFSTRFIIISVLILAVCGPTLGLSARHLLQLSRSQPSPGHRKSQFCPGLGGGGGTSSSTNGGKRTLEFAYANHAAALSLSRSSLQSGSTLRSSSVSRLHSGNSSRSPVASVYNNNNNNNNNSVSRPTSSRLPSPAPAASAKAVASVVASSSSNPPSPPIPKEAKPPSPPVAKKSPTAPVALKAEPIRSGGRRQQAANQRAKSPLANQRATMPAAVALTAAPSANHHRAGSPAAATTANQNHPNGQSASPAANQERAATLPSGGPARNTTTVVAPNGKRESNF